MNSSTVISVRNVSKAYKIGGSQFAKVLATLIPAYTRGVSDFFALKDVTFDIQAGESVAIIGRNGGGKSTLLEIITGTREATTGVVDVNGRVAALLQLGSGFNPEFTGRENVFLNGLLLGLSRDQVEDKFEEIVAFSGIGNVLDKPVKNYSSGMLVRLAFSVQVALEPEVLIVDEALSVGDFFFQQKCAIRMQELRKKGTTILFVSHSMEAVKKTCDRAIVLEEGKLIFDGDKDKAIQLYLTGSEKKKHRKVALQADMYQNIEEQWAQIKEKEENLVWENDSLADGGIIAVCAEMPLGGDLLTVLAGDKRTIRVYFKPPQDVSCLVSFEMLDQYGHSAYSTTSAGLGIEPFTDYGNGLVSFEIEVGLLLRQGQYSFQFKLHAIDLNNRANVGERLSYTPALGPFVIYFDSLKALPFRGNTGLPVNVRVNNTSL